MRLLRNRDFIFSLALVLGLGAGGGAVWTRPLALPALAAVMTLSCLGVEGRLVRSRRDLLGAVAAGVLLPYLLLGGILATASQWFDDPAVRDGLVLLAAMPPGVAVIPFTDSFGGDRPFSLLATASAYLAALAVTPAVGLAVWGTDLVHPGQILAVLGELIVLPLVLSRLLLRTPLGRYLAPRRGLLVNWSFFLVIYTIVGLNRSFLLDAPAVLLPLAGVAVLSTFGVAGGLRLAGRSAGLPADRVVSCILLGTLKNYGLAGGLALAFFPQTAAVPAVVAGTVMIPYVVWLGRAGPEPAGGAGARGAPPGGR